MRGHSQWDHPEIPAGSPPSQSTWENLLRETGGLPRKQVGILPFPRGSSHLESGQTLPHRASGERTRPCPQSGVTLPGLQCGAPCIPMWVPLMEQTGQPHQLIATSPQGREYPHRANRNPFTESGRKSSRERRNCPSREGRRDSRGQVRMPQCIMGTCHRTGHQFPEARYFLPRKF